MTTLISLAARDFIVVGCDSLATFSTDLVHPGRLAFEFFDDSGALKVDANGQPLLKSSSQLWEQAENLPINNLPSVTKLFPLEPYRACLLFAGISRIGETTIRNFVETFKQTLPDLGKKTSKKIRPRYTLEWLANRLKDHVLKIYEAEIPSEVLRTTMEIILSGYSEDFREPELWRINFSYNRYQAKFLSTVMNPVPRKEHNVIFGGQYDVVQRIVNGIDNQSTWALRGACVSRLEESFDELQAEIEVKCPGVRLTKPDFWDERYNLFGNDGGGVKGIFTDVGSLSEQAGIDLVYFLVSVMIQAQSFATSIPTVGGKIHIAILTKDEPFRWISEEAYTFEGKPIPKFPQHA